MEEWGKIISNLGLAVAIIIAFGYFFNKKIWPYLTSKWDEMQRRMDEKDKRVIEIQEQHKLDVLRIVENYERHTNAQLITLDHHRQQMIELKNEVTINHNAVMTELQYLKQSSDKKDPK